jgi:drug/metabolite transporter (DMT)-like permease
MEGHSDGIVSDVAFLLALLIFVLGYGLLFRAEQYMPSGIAALMTVTIQAFTSLLSGLME